MVTLASGLVGGLLGAAVTGAAMTVRDDEPGPSATVWAMYFGDGDPGRYETQGLVVHVLYGAVAGALFAGFAGSFGLGVGTVSGTLTWALVWAAVLAIVAVGFWRLVAIGDDLDPRALAELGAMHVAYGVVLGLVAFYLAGL